MKLGARIHAGVYRLSGGKVRVSIGGMRILILTTKGRRSGKPHSVPLGYMSEGGSYVVTASYGGSARHPAWYLNLLSEPMATTLVSGRRVPVIAQTVNSEAREQLWTRLVDSVPLYQKYQDRTKRQIPMVYLNPAPDRIEEEA